MGRQQLFTGMIFLPASVGTLGNCRQIDSGLPVFEACLSASVSQGAAAAAATEAERTQTERSDLRPFLAAGTRVCHQN